jgi:hypothetical protein
VICADRFEKYLKCILFIRRVPAKHLRHDLGAGPRLIEASRITLELTDRARKFIERVDDIGRFRYMEVSLFVDGHWIVALDQTVWELRRFTTLDPKVTSVTLVEGKWAPLVSIVGGHLEDVLKKRTNLARSPLLWHNGYFGRGRSTVTVSRRPSFAELAAVQLARVVGRHTAVHLPAEGRRAGVPRARETGSSEKMP